MKKIEYIWRELLYRAIEKQNPTFSMTDLSCQFHLSTSMVSHALHPLRQLHMVEIGKKQSSVVDVEKLLFFWATRRNIDKDLIYKTHSKLSVFDREALMPSSVFPSAYSACRLYFDIVPADYDHIYFYTKDYHEIEKRFPKEEKKEANLFILKQDPFLSNYKKVSLVQVFADIWNLPEWYSREFADAILHKIKGMIGL